MSFVGPRPIRPRFFAELANDLPAYWQRLVVRPGLTGFAQVRRGYETSMAEKLAHDLEWIADRSVRLYLRTVDLHGRAASSGSRSARCGAAARCAASAGSPPHAAPSTPERLARMSATLLHRGPDSRGNASRRRRSDWRRGGSRSSTSTGGDQPIANEDGTVVVVQNGEIYNHLELRAELERAGHRFRTRCDTEVLVHGYEQWGRGLWERLRGMFAVALHDARSRTLVLARDPFGIKPLYYREQGGELSFASELDALPTGEIDLDALEAFLAFNVIPAPLSIFREIRKLPAGHTLSWSENRSSLERYARPGPLPERTDDDEAELVEECRARLRDSVRAHLIADVPVGVLLSGGVDSGALTALAAEESTDAVRTFSIGFEEASFDELAGARAVAERYGTRHRELVLRPDAALLLPALADAFDEPFADSSALPTYLVSKLAAEDVKVALSGEGGDELFGGYYTYVADLLAQRLGPAASLVRPAIELLPSSSGRRASTTRRSASCAPRTCRRSSGITAGRRSSPPTARAELLASRGAADPVDGLRARFAETEGHALLARLQDVDFGTYLVDDLLVKTDRASMAWSLEARVPFMDPALANFAFSLPTRRKVRGLRKKVLLRKAVEPLLPPEIVHGRKRGFSIPAAAWLRGDLLPFARETLAPETIRRQGFLQPEAVGRVLDRHAAGREDLSRQLWGLLAFTLWYERHVEGVRRDTTLEGVVAGQA